MGRLDRAAVLLALPLLAGCYDLDKLQAGLADASDASAAVDLAALTDGTSDLAPPLVDLAGTTGSPCDGSFECLGVARICVHTDSNAMQTWPGGYCTAICKTSENSDGGNPACSGVAGCEQLSSTTSICTADCAAAGSCRAGYSCFFEGCLPTGYSLCNPSRSGPLPCPSQDGGIARDGGTTGPIVCQLLGFDNVGACLPECGVFKQDCPQPFVCFPNPITGQGACVVSSGTGTQGSGCRIPTDCAVGFFCVSDGTKSTCRRLCATNQVNGPPCPNGLSCQAIGLAPPSLVGGCI